MKMYVVLLEHRQIVAENQYGHTKISLEKDSDAKKCLIAFGMKKWVGLADFFC